VRQLKLLTDRVEVGATEDFAKLTRDAGRRAASQ
jgi:hypothetical protein